MQCNTGQEHPVPQLFLYQPKDAATALFHDASKNYRIVLDIGKQPPGRMPTFVDMAGWESAGGFAVTAGAGITIPPPCIIS